MATNRELIGQINKKSDFTVVLSDFNFEGPIDLLLQLIESAKLDISLVSISKITEPFLEYVRTIEVIDLEKAAEFLDVAATLLEMKSKAMLPRLEMFMANDEDDAGTRLLQRVAQYKLMKEAAEKLKPLEEVGRFFKEPDLSCADVRTVLKDMTLDGLINAFKALLSRSEVQKRKPVKAIALDRWTVAQKIDHIREAICEYKELSFFELFSADYSKSEIINTFLALLELMRMQTINVVQGEIFGDITLKINEESLRIGN